MIKAGARPHDLESHFLEFKEQSGSFKDTMILLARTAVCFANASGGTIIVGLDDDGTGPSAFRGCTLDPTEVQRRVYQLTEPALLVTTQRIQFDGMDLLIVWVPESCEIHADTQGRASRRMGTDCLTLTPRDQERLREERRGFDWSAQPAGLGVMDTAPQAVEVARDTLARFDDDRRPLAELSRSDLLRALGVVDRRGRLLNAGAVLFCDPLAHLGCQILYQYRSTPGGEATAVERLGGPLLPAFERTLQFVRARRNVTPVNLPGGQQIELADFPEAAVREALSNAVLHRDYRLDGPVNVEHSPSSFVVVSPGPLMGGVTVENILTHPSKPRNRCLAGAARLLRLAEETGRGVDRMYREMIRAGREIPVIENRIDSVRVALLGGAPRTQVARFVAQLPAVERDDTDTLLVVLTLCNRRTISAAGLAPIIHKQPAEAEAVLTRLSRDDVAILEPTRATRRLSRAEYRLGAEALRALGSAVRYHRRTVEEIDGKVVAHVQEYGRVTNRTLQNLLDLDVYKARDILGDLVRRRVIVKTSEQQRGPNVEYGPGPKFPAKARQSGWRVRSERHRKAPPIPNDKRG